MRRENQRGVGAMTDRIDALRALEKAVEAGEFSRPDGFKRYSALYDRTKEAGLTVDEAADAAQALHRSDADLMLFIRALIAQEGGE